MEPIFIQILSLVFLGTTVFLIKRKKDFIAESDQTTGTVIAFQKRKKPGRNAVYAPVIEYSVSGRLLQHKSSTFKAWRGYSIGESVLIFYKRDKPDDALIDSFMEKWSLALIFAIIATLFFWIGFHDSI